jgi:hypothetical protein
MSFARSDVAAFVASFGTRVEFGEHQSLGWGNPINAGVVFHDWEPEKRRIEISAASTTKHWLTRARVKAIFDYPFAFCDLVYCRSDHPTVHRFFAALGGDVTPTPVWTICTLTAAQWKARRL